MSRFINEKYKSLVPYAPGEQPQRGGFIKLNTNESPFPPSPKVAEAARSAGIENMNRYPDPEASLLIKAAARFSGLPENMIIAGNGSDELLAFSFMAFSGPGRKVVFADVSYGFYKVYADVFGADAKIIPLNCRLGLDVEDYFDSGGMVVIANPGAQTGAAAPREGIERVLVENRGNLVLIDEAYVDFGAESCLPLIGKYDNLLVVQTLSKSRNLAGARVGLAFACSDVIGDIAKMKYSFNPYNLNRFSILAGAAALSDREYFEACVGKIKETREEFTISMSKLGFSIIPSLANFVLARHSMMPGAEYCFALKNRGILVRHFNDGRISDYVRITIGKKEDMEQLVAATKEMLGQGGVHYEGS